jgi:hypothetical protein
LKLSTSASVTGTPNWRSTQRWRPDSSPLEGDHKEYKEDLQRVCARELEATQREKKVARREEVVT